MRLTCRHLLRGSVQCLIFIFFLAIANNSLAQTTKNFKGVIRNERGEPLPGVTVVVKGSNASTVTDASGAFSIDAAEGSTVVVTSVGHSVQEFALRGSDVQSIRLSESAQNLDQVVVVAYGTQRKKDITGSVAVVSMNEARKYSTSDVAQLLQGRATGVQVNSDGQPGAVPNVRIRGIGTFGNGQPLYVIDGVQVGTVIRDFSPNDIESMQVLKDASAAALYGSAAANGVIIITTKQGKKNTPLRVDYNGYYGFDKVWQIVDVADRATYQLLNNEARTNAGKALAPGNNSASPRYISNIDTDWQKQGLKTGNRQNHNIAFSGGGANNAYNISLDYFNNEGTYVGNGPDYTRYSVRINSSAEKGIFKIGENVFYSHSTENALMSTTGNGLAGALPPLINVLVYAIPTLGIHDPTNEGGYAGTLTEVEDVISLNGIGLNSLIKRKIDVDRTFANVYGELQMIKNNGHNLRYRLNLSYDKTQVRDYNFKPGFDLGYFFQLPIAQLNDNSAVHTTALIENTLTYQKAFNKHNVELLAGQTFQKSTSLFRNGFAEGFTRPYYPVLGGGGATSTDASGSLSEYAKASYLARANYNFDDKYLLTASVRRDASSRFSESTRVGYFPSVAVGWRLSNENFINLPKNIVSDIKLRASYGKLGNDNIGDYRFQPTINPNVIYTYDNNGVPVRSVGAIQTNIVDPNIKWEDRVSSNIGLDVVLFNGNVDFSAEYYYNESTDLLVEVPIPMSFGSVNNRPVVNAGTLRNSGLEFSAAYHQTKNAFTYDISVNVSTVNNKVLSLGSNTGPTISAGAITQVGTEIGQHYGWVYDGIFQTAAEVAASPFQEPFTAAGDIKFKDISGPDGKPDGRITDLDRTVLGSAIPKYNFGFGFSAGYKNFDLALFASGSAKYLINSRFYRDLMHTGGSANYSTDMLNRWTPTNTNTNIPRLNVDDVNLNDRNSNRPGWLQDGSYLRINTLSLGYNFRSGIIKGITKLRVYATAQNLYSFQKYKGYNPDFTSIAVFPLTSSIWNPGFDEGSYPKPRTIMAGVQLGF